jgi:tetratricopeptide (TPR) repeat protein
MARLDRLPASAKEIAQVASVIGREFDRSLLAEVVAISGSALDAALRKLLAAQLVVIGGMSHQTLLFRHALIQDTAYQSLLSRKRRQYHQAIADTIVKSHPDVVATQPELVARHYSDAQRTDLALPYWKTAGERALEHSANYEAVDHFSNVLAIVEGLPEGPDRDRQILAARLRLAEAMREAGRAPAAIEHFHMAAERARAMADISSFVRAAVGYEDALFNAGVPLDPSIAILREAESVVTPDDDRLRCLILTRLARAHLLIGETGRSESFERQAAVLAQRLDDRESLFTLRANRFIIPRPIGSPQEVQGRLAELDELIELSKGLKDKETHARAHLLNVYIPAELGERARMDQSVAALVEWGDAHQRLRNQWIARHGQAMLAILDGNFSTADKPWNSGIRPAANRWRASTACRCSQFAASKAGSPKWRR